MYYENIKLDYNYLMKYVNKRWHKNTKSKYCDLPEHENIIHDLVKQKYYIFLGCLIRKENEDLAISYKNYHYYIPSIKNNTIYYYWTKHYIKAHRFFDSITLYKIIPYYRYTPPVKGYYRNNRLLILI